MKNNLLTLFLLSACFYSQAQIKFQKTFGGANNDYGVSVQQTADSGYIVAGATLSFGAGLVNAYLIKTNVNGDTLWTKTFGGTLGNDVRSVQQTTDGGYIIGGKTSSFGGGDYDFYLIKTDANGNALWTKTFGGINADHGNSVQQTADGGYIITGWSVSFGASNSHVYLVKTDAAGDTLWTKTFGGISGNEQGNSVQQTTDGGYIIAGRTYSFGAGLADVYLIKTDSNGDTLWSKTYGDTYGDEGWSVQQTTDGGYIITGFTYNTGVGSFDNYLIKTDANGNTLWSKAFGGTGSDYGYFVRPTTDGGYIIAGSTNSFGAGDYDGYLIKTNANGDSLWTKTFGGTGIDGAASVDQAADGGYIIVGHTYSFGAGIDDVYLIKTDSLGDSGCNESNTTTIVTTPTTQVINAATIVISPPTIVTTPVPLVGSGGTVTILCGCSSYFTLYADTIPHNWIAVNQASGQSPITYSWNWGDGSANSTGPTPSHTYNSPGYYNICLTINDAAGCSSTYCDSSTYLSRGNTNNTLVTVNVVLPTSINTIEQNQNIPIVSPNPSSGNFIISMQRTIAKGAIEMINILGERVFNENISNESQKEINLKNISGGIYFVKVFDGEKYYCTKIIIE